MNSARTLVTLRAKRAAVLAWIDSNALTQTDPNDGIALWHWSYAARLDDAIDYLELRVGDRRWFQESA